MITSDILAEFKERMHLEGDEDANLTRILHASQDALFNMCGTYDIHTNQVFKELVFERARYAYNDALEYFKDNFQTEINNLAIANAIAEMSDNDATI